MTLLEKVSKNKRVNYKVALRNVLESLEDEDIHWRQYLTWELPDDLQSNIDWVRRVSPIFANNYVVHHAPHLLAKQFGLTNNVKYTLYHIGMKDNRGSKSHNWTKKYEVHIAKWMNPLFLEDPPAVHGETSPSREDNPALPPLQLSPGSEDPPSSSREDPSSRISKVAGEQPAGQEICVFVRSKRKGVAQDPHAAHQETGPDPPESFEPITDLHLPVEDTDETGSPLLPQMIPVPPWTTKNRRNRFRCSPQSCFLPSLCTEE
ncbi:serine/threonine-protein phosphatase [Striga asiatica]|uniref:Serine/threonine-protein phosphatase n=1 Tax=Striga asiatica TaxID=4170 RepID=A0A5A7PMC8_STRAF|nr:serine/threonine-protein phosphatase [Striga asiatica]